MSIRSSLLFLGAGLLALGTAAAAQPPAPPPGGGWGKAPPASRAELKAQLEKRFDALDADRNGTLTPQERQAARAEARAKMRDHVFARLDADKDGTISKAEFDAARDKRAEGARERKDRRGHGPMAGMKAPRHAPGADRNAAVTRTQFVEAGLARFDRVDTDHDGTISPAEREAARKAMRDRLAPANRPAPPPPGQ